MVNTPDYSGPSAAFGASGQAGHATLDSIRAVLNLANLTGPCEITTPMWGYSGGTIATEAAAEFQSHYAPELELAGTVLGGLVDDISADFDNLNKSPIACTLVAVLLGLTAQYPEAKACRERQLLPKTKDEFLSARHTSFADATRRFAGRDVYGYFKGGAADLQALVLRNLYNAQTKPGSKGVPAMPMFVYKAIRDQYCPVEQTDMTVQRFCSAGVDITYERNTVSEHVSEIKNGKQRATKWLWSVFDELYGPSVTCSVRDVTVDIPTETSVESR
ncbi:lipase [Ilyonectria destructans]|nr:lipase [Ilyonectria destructans]